MLNRRQALELQEAGGLWKALSSNIDAGGKLFYYLAMAGIEIGRYIHLQQHVNIRISTRGQKVKGSEERIKKKEISLLASLLKVETIDREKRRDRKWFKYSNQFVRL